MTKLFFIRGSKKGKRIYLRVRDGRNVDCKIATQFKVEEANWDKVKGWPKDHRDNFEFQHLNKELNNILNNVRDYERGPGNPNRSDVVMTIDTAWLKEAITFNLEKSSRVLVLDQLATYRDRLSNRSKDGRVGVSAGTIKNFNTTISRLKRFEKSTGHKYSLEELSFEFHDNYIAFARESLELAVNSIGKDIKNIKAMANDAKDRGMKVNPNVQSKRFHAPSEKTEFVILSPAEIQTLFEFEGPDFLENARNWLLIGMWTAIRAEDLLRLDESNILNYKDTKIIRYTQSKTGKVVRLAIHPHVEEILARNNGKFPRRISYTKFNEYIKELCRRAGMIEPVKGNASDDKTKKRKRGVYPKWKVVSTHIMRRSFSCNHYGLVPTSKIIAATGHSTEKQLLNYIDETLVEHVDDFLDLWSKNK